MKRLFGVVAILFLGVAAKPAVTLDVKDEDVRVILKSMQQQCAIRNLVIDPDVSGHGTFFFHDLPCRTAFDTVLTTMRLAAEVTDDVVAVERRR